MLPPSHDQTILPPPTGGAWTFTLVEERLVEAMILLWRLPDRERGWLRAGTMGLWRQVSPTVGMNAVEIAEWRLAYAAEEARAPRPAAATRAELGEMEEALGWVECLSEADRKLVGLALRQLARGERQVSWRALLAPMGLARGSDGLRKRYGRALASIAGRLNG